jgi:Flp pilus assembly protein TadD
VLQGGEVVQVAMELIDPTSGESLWAATVSKPAIDVVTLQRELAAEIADGIRARLTPEQRAGLATARRVDPDAYAQYLLGQEQLLRWTDEGFRRGVEHLIRSLARDSLFSPAWAMLATGYSWALFYGWVPGAEARGAIDRAATRALALDARQGDPHIARGMAHLFVDWDFGAAEREFRRGATFSLSAAAWDQYAMFFWEMGRFDEAMGAIRKAIDLEPTTAQWHSDLGWFLQSAGDTAGQRVATMRAIALDPTFFEAHDQLGEIELACGNLAAARAELERAKALAGGDYAWSPALEGRLLVAERRIPEARALLARLDRDPANRRYALQALVHLALGERDSTYVMLERGIAAREPEAILILTATPALYPLHGEPRYRQLRRRAGIPG